MIEQIKKWSAIILPLLIAILVIRGCQKYNWISNPLDKIKIGNTEVNAGVVPTAVATDLQKKAAEKVAGKDAVIKGVIDLGKKQSGDDKSKVVNGGIVVVADSKCNTCEVKYVKVEEEKLYLGFSFRPKVYAGAGLGGPNFGYAQEFFRWGKATTNVLVGFPTVGLGLGYDITNNFYGFAGANMRYMGYEDLGKPETYYIDPTAVSKYYPLVGIGFYF